MLAASRITEATNVSNTPKSRWLEYLQFRILGTVGVLAMLESNALSLFRAVLSVHDIAIWILHHVT